MAQQDYAKLKNAELEALLKQRGLQTGGKKADMVARLQAADAESSKFDEHNADAASAPADSDIKTSEALAPASAAPASTASTTGAETKSDNAVGAATEDTSQSKEEPDKKMSREEREAAKSAKRAEDEKKFGQGMSATDIDAEIARRKRRAEKFGVPLSAEAEDGIKALERAKKFGTVAPETENTTETGDEQSKTVLGLDSALPERQRKRGRDEGANSCGGKRQRGGAAKGRGGAAAAKAGGQDWMNEADRAKAEARKAKWGAA